MSDFFTFDQNCVRALVISHVDQEILDSVCLELIDCSLDIELELSEVASKRAKEHLTRARSQGAIMSVTEPRWGARTTPVFFLGRMKDFITPVLPLVGFRVGTNESGRPTAVLG